MHLPIRISAFLASALFGTLLVPLLAGCGQRGAPVDLRRADLAAHDALWLLPPRLEARVGEDLDVALLVGDALASADAEVLAAGFDPASARCAGSRENELAARFVDGASVLPVRFAEAGDGVVGLTLAARGDRHAKCLFPVVTGGQEPRGAEGAFARRLGLVVEIVTMVDPTALEAGAQLPLRVRSEVGTTGGAEVVIKSRAQGASGAPREVFRGRADADGNVLFEVGARGWHFVAATTRDREGQEHVTTLTFHVGGGR